MYRACHDNKCDKRDALVVDGEPATSRDIAAVVVVVEGYIFL